MHDQAITFYWRPGCPFCARLARDLSAKNLAFTPVNIWEDPDAAAFVRSVTGGSETVPTVAVGDVALVNPSVNELLDIVAGNARAV